MLGPRVSMRQGQSEAVQERQPSHDKCGETVRDYQMYLAHTPHLAAILSRGQVFLVIPTSVPLEVHAVNTQTGPNEGDTLPLRVASSENGIFFKHSPRFLLFLELSRC